MTGGDLLTGGRVVHVLNAVFAKHQPPIRFRFFGKMRTTVANWVNSKVGGTKIITDGAIIGKASLTDDEWATVMSKMANPTFEINAEVMSDLDSLLKQAHAPIVFVISPVTKFWYEKFAADRSNPDGLAELLTRLRAYPNTRVIDLMTPNVGVYSNAEFFDPTHLNEHGARRFSKELASRIEVDR